MSDLDLKELMHKPYYELKDKLKHMVISSLYEEGIRTYTLENVGDDFIYVRNGEEKKVVCGYNVWGLGNQDNLKNVVNNINFQLSSDAIYRDITLRYPCTVTTPTNMVSKATILFTIK